MTSEEGLRQVLLRSPGGIEVQVIPCQRCEAYRAEIAGLNAELAVLRKFAAEHPQRDWSQSFADGLAKHLAGGTKPEVKPPQKTEQYPF